MPDLRDADPRRASRAGLVFQQRRRCQERRRRLTRSVAAKVHGSSSPAETSERSGAGLAIMELTELHKKIIETAKTYDGVYHLPRRFGRSYPYVEKTELDLKYDACHELVSGGLARWKPNGPAIRLTANALLRSVCR